MVLWSATKQAWLEYTWLCNEHFFCYCAHFSILSKYIYIYIFLEATRQTLIFAYGHFHSERNRIVTIRVRNNFNKSMPWDVFFILSHYVKRRTKHCQRKATPTSRMKIISDTSSQTTSVVWIQNSCQWVYKDMKAIPHFDCFRQSLNEVEKSDISFVHFLS